MMAKKEENGIYGHLTWPCDWNQTDRFWDEDFCKALPIFSNPMCVYPVYPEDQDSPDSLRFQIQISYVIQDYKKRVQDVGLNEWFEVLRQNLYHIGHACIYLNQQTVGDLSLLASMKPDPKGQIPGKVF